MVLWRIIGTVVGGALFLIGIPLLISPIPLGALLLFVATIILVASNPLAAKLLKAARKRFRWLNRFFRKAEKVLPKDIAKPIADTDDETDQEDEEPPVKKHHYGEPMRRTGVHRRLR
ncbi:hypothetical protein [Parvularcula maris]|uniref:DUF454 family protein n=1 Tax=Parvularcula maris TaxID=2965077 RepID=A0A9X2L6Z7_9PROT|nr:hypothetical protein [Parvularcula maris]MCQ8184309.1 hypothetical protein [Parvularcula maris]